MAKGDGSNSVVGAGMNPNVTGMRYGGTSNWQRGMQDQVGQLNGQMKQIFQPQTGAGSLLSGQSGGVGFGSGQNFAGQLGGMSNPGIRTPREGIGLDFQGAQEGAGQVPGSTSAIAPTNEFMSQLMNMFGQMGIKRPDNAMKPFGSE